MAKALARPIRTARDHKNASALAKKALRKSGGEPAAEQRLQALLHEIEKFDGDDAGDDYEESTGDLDGLPRRRWSDDLADEA
jgi:hypothetical protein